LPFPWLPLDSTLGLAFLGRLRKDLGQGSASAASPDYLVVANPTLVNGNLDAPQGWLTEGTVDFTNGAAILRETTSQQTRLSQAFVVGAQDRFLSFTIGDSALDDQLMGPDDAFEVALVDANTGASLASALNLTRTDALLNRQASGLERLSSGITRTVNPDGSVTYLMDLSGIAAGTGIHLIFDLIGFGAAGSRVAVNDVRLISNLNTAPTAADDAVTTAEDAPITFNVLLNDQDAEGDTALAKTVI
jgi:hypothetical protein